jgi:molybdenum cofactor cytidylyltransferase
MSVVILLAAGSARRFGSQKLLARLPDGTCVVEAAAKKLTSRFSRVVAIVGNDVLVRDRLEKTGCETCVNPRAAEGMGTSLALGVAQAADAESWLIALGDMPFVQPETLDAIECAGRIGEHIVVPRFGQLRGHPVRFPAAVREELLALEGDSGARALLARHSARVLVLPTEDRGVVADIDTPDDLFRSVPG